MTAADHHSIQISLTLLFSTSSIFILTKGFIKCRKDSAYMIGVGAADDDLTHPLDRQGCSKFLKTGGKRNHACKASRQ